MALKFIANVKDLSVRIKGKEKLVKRGEALPDGVDDQVRVALQRMGLVVPTDAAAGATATADTQVLVIDPTKLPAARDPRPVWDAFAATVDLSEDDVKGFSTKDDLVAEVTKRFEERNK